MRRTNVFLEVEDRVYDVVIEPHKKAKTFSKLVAALLKGYIEDEYVRAYGDELVEDLKKASVDSLDDVLGSMQESLATMGLFTDELQMVNNKGSKIFSKKVEEHQKEFNKSEEFAKETFREDTRLKEENEKLQKEMEDLKKQMSNMSSQNLEILSVLKNLTNVAVKEEVVEKEEITVKEDKVSNSLKEVVYTEDNVTGFVEDATKSEKEEELEEDTPSFDMSFLTDAAMSF